METSNNFQQILDQLNEQNRSIQTIDISGMNLTDESIHILSNVVSSNKITRIDLMDNFITHLGVYTLLNALKHNDTLLYLYLTANQIDNQGAYLLSHWLQHNPPLKSLFMAYNQIGDDGITALSTSLLQNTTLTSLGLEQNYIHFQGAKALSITIRNNNTLKWINLDPNDINYEGQFMILEATRFNTSLTQLDIQLFPKSEIQQEITDITYWNWKEVFGEKESFPWSYRDHLVYILMLFNDLPICSDLHWMILNMLKVKDVVKYNHVRDYEEENVEGGIIGPK